MSLETLMILVPALPLAASLLTALLGAKVLRSQAHWPTVIALAGSFLCSLALYGQVKEEAQRGAKNGGNDGVTATVGFERIQTLWQWASVSDAYQPRSGVAASQNAAPEATDAASLPFTIDVTLRADPLTSVMLVMVTFISTLVAIYAAGYMHGDAGYWRFFTYVALFVFSMTMLVSVSNFLLLYVFWEAVGVCSYLLIGFWYQKPEAAAAGKKAFLVNRIGDFGFALGVFLLWTTYGTLNFHDLTEAGAPAGILGQARLSGTAPLVGGWVGVAICLLLFVGACGKSAQFPLHVWLPDAMEGPTPVSALIHAATMVTAGVYLVTRCTPLFSAVTSDLSFAGGQWWADPSLVVAVIGALTALLAGLIALTQTDLKRVLAYSTVSQLGFMFLALGTGSRAGIIAGMFHLFTHAFFKALLFLGAGSVMHAMGGVIDMRRFSGLKKLMPVTHWTFLFGCLALAGVVPFAGFWSKDAILVALYERGAEMRLAGCPCFTLLFCLAVGMAGMTAFYTFRAFFLTFYGEERIPHEAGHHAHESPLAMTGPLAILAFCALAVGVYCQQTGSFENFLSLTPSLQYLDRVAGTAANAAAAHGHATHGGGHDAHLFIGGLSSIVAALCIGLAAYLYLGDRREIERMRQAFRPAYALSYGKFFLDELYYACFVWPLKVLAQAAYWIDRTLVDGLVDLAGSLPGTLGKQMRSLQNGLAPFYALAMLLGLLVLMFTLVPW